MIKFDYNTALRVTSISFNGRMDTVAVEKLHEIILVEAGVQQLGKGDVLVLDLAEVDYIASSFIRICMKFAKTVGDPGFSIINCQPFVKKTFKISGLDDVLHVS